MQLALVASLAAQSLLLAGLTMRGGESTGIEPPAGLLVGDTIGAVRLSDGGMGTLGDSARRAWTLLLVYSAECQWCDSVAPAWQAATQAPRPSGLRLVGVSRDSLVQAATYATRHGWELDAIQSLETTLPRSREARLTSRTPWYFLLDPAGRIRSIGHGAEIQQALQLVDQP
jgi:peroxiredoxin